MMSLPVVMNGPVAIAGSIPKRSRIIGTEVPIRAATIITQIIDADIVKLMSIGWLITRPKRITMILNMIPFKRVRLTSLNNLEIILPLITSFASP